MKKFSALIASSVISLSPLLAEAAGMDQFSNYFGGSVILAEYDESGFDTFDAKFVQLQLGHEFNENFAIEARAGLGIGDDSKNYSGLELTLEPDYVYSAFLKASLPFDQIDLYALAGYTRAKLTFKGELGSISVSDSETDGDFSYGFGAAYTGFDNVDLFLEYIKYYDKDDIEVDGWNLGVNCYF